MSNPEGPLRPLPPQKPVPPLPPGFTLKGIAPHPAQVQSSQPDLLDFMTRRLETLERELVSERERALSAQNLLARQEELRGEVETQMKAISEQLRREKAERDANEHKSHAQGRIETLERRLDEMHQTWSNILKEALAARDKPGATPDPGRLAEGISSLDDRLAALERHLRLDHERQEERLQAFARDKASLQEALQEQASALRSELARERADQQAGFVKEASRQSEQLKALHEGRQSESARSEDLKTSLDKIISHLTATPQAKDAALEAVEQEKRELLGALNDRRESLRRFMEERRAIEATLGESMLLAQRETAAEREKSSGLQRRIMELEIEIQSFKDMLENAERRHQSQEERFTRLAAERDALARHLLEEADKVKAQIEARRQAEASWAQEMEVFQKKVSVLSLERLNDGSALSELRAQLSILTEQLAKSLREKAQLEARFANWDQERRQLQETLGKKDEMMSLFSATFQNILKKS